MSLSRPYFIEIEAGENLIYPIETFWRGTTIAVTPGESGTMTVEYRLTDNTDYKLWPLGEVGEYSEDKILTQCESFRITAIGANGKVEIVP